MGRSSDVARDSIPAGCSGRGNEKYASCAFTEMLVQQRFDGDQSAFILSEFVIDPEGSSSLVRING